MTLHKARDLLQTQADFGGFYNRHGAKLILAEVMCEHGQVSVDQLIAELNLGEIFQFQPGDLFEPPS
jgi:hypothetical protein